MNIRKEVLRESLGYTYETEISMTLNELAVRAHNAENYTIFLANNLISAWVAMKIRENEGLALVTELEEREERINTLVEILKEALIADPRLTVHFGPKLTMIISKEKHKYVSEMNRKWFFNQLGI